MAACDGVHMQVFRDVDGQLYIVFGTFNYFIARVCGPRQMQCGVWCYDVWRVTCCLCLSIERHPSAERRPRFFRWG